MKQKQLFFVLILISKLCFAQQYIYQNFGVDEGLPSSEVYDMYQDKKGYIWFATDKGLSRFNGYEFENFTTKNGLPDNTILDFYPQENGEVWCYAYHTQSFFYFNEVFKGFSLYKYNSLIKENINSKAVVRSFLLDKDSNVFIGGYHFLGLLSIDNKGNIKRKPYKKFIDKNYYLRYSKTNNSFFISSKNDILLNTYSSINLKYSLTSRIDLLELNNKETIFIDSKLGIHSKEKGTSYFNTEQNPIGIKKINNNMFFVGYYKNGAEFRDKSGKVLETFLPKKSITSFLIDAEGSYWFATLDDGVFYIKNPNIKIFTQTHISSIVKDDKNILHLGYNNGNIASINNNKMIIKKRGKKNSAAIVSFNKKKRILYSYTDGVLYTNDLPIYKEIILANNLPENIENKSIATASHFFYQLKNNELIQHSLDKKIQDICTFNDTVFIGTSSGLYIKIKDSLQKYQPSTLLKYRIDDIDVNNTETKLFLATQDAGLVIYDKDTIFNISKKEGLTNNIVSEVYIENDSTIWACTNTGLNRIDFTKNNYTVTTITKSDGLLSNDIVDVEVVNDTVWVATKKGLCYFNKKILNKSDDVILSLSILETKANNKIIRENDVLYNDQNNISFKIQAITYKNNDKLSYLYRIKELDTAWSKTSNRTIKFPSLAPGKYTFEVKASLLNPLSNNLVSYNFKILPPFWKTWWFKSIIVLIISYVIYLFFKIKVFTYNKDIIRELLRLALKRIKRKELYYKFRSNGEDFKISTNKILYINSQGNYLDIYTNNKTYTIRCKIGVFLSTTPDSLEYLRVHRSYIVRIDQITSKGKNWVMINNTKIPVGETYLEELRKIKF